MPPTLLTTVSSRPNSSYAACARPATASRSLRSAGTTSAAASGRPDLLGDPSSCSRGARRDEHVGAGLGERDGGGGAEAAARAGDDRDLVGDAEAVEDAHLLTRPRPVTERQVERGDQATGCGDDGGDGVHDPLGGRDHAGDVVVAVLAVVGEVALHARARR